MRGEGEGGAVWLCGVGGMGAPGRELAEVRFEWVPRLFELGLRWEEELCELELLEC